MKNRVLYAVWGMLMFAGATMQVVAATVVYDPAEPIVSFSVNSLDFGTLDVGGISDPLSVRLSNTGSAALDISHLYATSAIFSQTNNCNNYVPSGGNCTINVTFIPTAAQNYTENLTVISDAIGSPHTVSLTGRGGDGSTQTKSTGSAGNYVLHVNFENRVANTPYTESQIIQDFNANKNDGAIHGPDGGRTNIVLDPADTGRGNVMRVTHPAGEFAKGGANFKARFAPDNQKKKGSARFDDVYLTYDIYLSTNTKRMPYHKMPGLITGTKLEASHKFAYSNPLSHAEPEGIISFTALMQTFTSLAQPRRPDGTLALMYYDAEKTQKNDFLDTTDAKKETVVGSYVQPLGEWITIEQRVKLNTADSNDAYNQAADKKEGLVEVWIDGVKMSSKVHLWRHTNTMKADGFWFYDYYNNRRDLIDPPSKDQYVYYDNFRASQSPITH